MKNKKCFISYAHTDKEAVQKDLIPILRNLNLNVWFDENQLAFGENIFEGILKGIREADFIIAYFNGRSSYVNFEIGSAIGQNKPVIAVLNDKYSYPTDIRNLNYVYYNDNNVQNFKENLSRAIQIAQENVIDKLDIALNPNRKLIGIEVGTESKNYQEELRITADLISFLEELSGTTDFQLVQTSKGCLKSLLSLDLKAWAELLEKIIFIVPEMKKRKAERLKIEAETEKIKVETNDKETDTKIKQANALLDIIERSNKLGLKLQIDDDLILLNNDNILRIKEPEKPSNE